ncbi:MAG TPA: phage portal protein, partial [Enhygromyxa sp.]|nr:phage portal protein [Enhygromyxa sp.]
ELRDASPTPWLDLPVTVMAQNLYVEGHYTSGNEEEHSKIWEKIWQANGGDALQIPIHRGALGHGLAHIVARWGTSSFSKERMIRLRGSSALRGCAVWREGDDSEFPEFYIEAYEQQLENGTTTWVVELIDEWGNHDLRYGNEGVGGENEWVYIDGKPHGAGVCPVVCFRNRTDLDGNVQGEVIPFIPLAKRIDQDTFDRLIVQRFGSWKIRTIAGIKQPETKAGQEELARILRVNDLLISDNPETRFGTLDHTPLDGYIAARDADIRDLAAVSQTPPHHLLGLSPNVSAEGLVEAQASLMRKVQERQHSFGESWELVMRLGAHMLGFREIAEDFNAQVRWRDTEVRSFQQVADALGKLATMVEVPVEMLWRELPNWTQQDIERAKKLREEAMQEAELLAMLEAGLDAPASGGPGTPTSSAGGPMGLTDEEQRRLNRMRGGYGPDWDGDGKPN